MIKKRPEILKLSKQKQKNNNYLSLLQVNLGCITPVMQISKYTKQSNLSELILPHKLCTTPNRKHTLWLDLSWITDIRLVSLSHVHEWKNLFLRNTEMMFSLTRIMLSQWHLLWGAHTPSAVLHINQLLLHNLQSDSQPCSSCVLGHVCWFLASLGW